LIFMFIIGVLLVSWAEGRDFAWALKDPIETRLSAEMGHPVTLEGEVGFDLSWTEVDVFVGSITTDLGDEQSALEASVFAERAGVTLGLWALVRGQVELRGLILREAQVTLPVPEATPADTVDRNPEFIFRILNQLRRVTLDNLTLVRQRANAEPQVAQIDSLIIAPEGEGLRAGFVGDIDGTPYDVEGVLENLQSFLDFEGSPAHVIARIGRNNVEGRGMVRRLWPFEAELDLTGDARNVARLAELMGLRLPGAGAGRFTGRLAIEERMAALTLADLVLDHNGGNGEDPATVFGPAQGNLTVLRTEADRFVVTGGLSAELLRVDPLLARGAGSLLGRALDVIETRLDTAQPLMERPIPYADVRRISGNVELAIDELQYRDAVFRNVVVPLSDEGGVLRVAGASASFVDRPINVTVAADSSTQTVTLSAHAHRIPIGDLTEQLGGNSFVHGPALIGIEGSGAGATLGEVMRNFSGQSNLMIGRGRLERGGIDFLAADLLRAFFTGGGQSTTPLVCLINRMDFENGVGTSRAFLMDTNLITITGSGQVNLSEDNVDFVLAPRPKDPTLLSFASDYRVTGPVLSPSISPRPGGILRGVATTLGSIALTGGAATLLPLLIQRGEDELANPCIAALIGEDVPAEVEIPPTENEEAAPE
jgi:hypothetical protein